MADKDFLMAGKSNFPMFSENIHGPLSTSTGSQVGLNHEEWGLLGSDNLIHATGGGEASKTLFSRSFTIKKNSCFFC